jgi:hypothetical protein
VGFWGSIGGAVDLMSLMSIAAFFFFLSRDADFEIGERPLLSPLDLSLYGSFV